MGARGERYRVAVVGPGALGLFYASRLAKVVPTAVVARNNARARELRAGVGVGSTIYMPDAFGPGRLPQADWVIVLVKGQHTAAAVKTAARLKPKGVVSLQNGLVDALPQGVTTAAAWREGSRIVPVAVGETLLPPGFGILAAYLRRAGFVVRTPRDIAAARYRKFLANVCLNPVTAVFRIPNGEVRKRPYSLFVEALAREAAAVLRIGQRQAVSGVMEVARSTAKNRSSMLQDVLAGRETEIEHLTGALLRLARRRQVNAPTHQAFYELVRNFPRVVRI